MTPQEIAKVLADHACWLKKTGGQRADLREADLCGANLHGANLDYAVWPLWCGSFNVKAGARLVAQLIAHVTRLDVADEPAEWVAEAMTALAPYADKFCQYQGDVKPLKQGVMEEVE